MTGALLVPLAARCVALVSWGAAGPLPEPRRCLHRVREGHDLCGLHLSLTTAERPRVESVEGGVCVWCVRPARRYRNTRGGVSIALCDGCAAAVARAVPRVR